MLRSFGSDNNSRAHPDIVKAVIEANQGNTVGYGDDEYTTSACNAFKNAFGDDTNAFFVFTGSAANVLAVGTALNSWEAVVVASHSHLSSDECGGPEKIAGVKVYEIATRPDGKVCGCVVVGVCAIDNFYCNYSHARYNLTQLTPDLLRARLEASHVSVHQSPIKLVSLSQSTEQGAVYTLNELCEISALCRQHKVCVDLIVDLSILNFFSRTSYCYTWMELVHQTLLLL
jgi:threonine aldolase